MKYVYAIAIIVLFSLQAQAQKSITIATDPLTIPALNGFQIEGGFSFGKNRITADYLTGELSPWYSKADDFKGTDSEILSLAYNRWLNNEQKGFNYGINFSFFSKFEVENNAGETLDKHPASISLRLAYAWYPFKNINLFIEPAMTFGFMILDEDLNFSNGETFKKKTFIGHGPLLNIGYKFNLD